MKIVILGPTGTIGSAVLTAAARDKRVKKVVAIARRQIGLNHPKVTQAICTDFSKIYQLSGRFDRADACLYCLGMPSRGVKESMYRKVTRDIAFATGMQLQERSPNAAFQFVSGKGTDPKSRMMWARIKGETEEDLKKIGMGKLNFFRPGYVHPIVERDDLPLSYRIMSKVYEPLRSISKNMAISDIELAHAMLQATHEKLDAQIFENADIIDLAERYKSK